MWTIVRFNWPFYLVAVVVLASAAWGIFASNALWLKSGFGSALLGSLYFLVGSLGVSHQVYDRSDLYRWKWLTRALVGVDAKGMIFCHSGFDEASQELEQLHPQADWTVLDHYDPALMTEASIRRARKRYPPTGGTQSAPYDGWPVASESADVIFGLLAIHELRSEAERSAWFSEAMRCLSPGGRVVLVEHVRDFANFVAFGPGFLHFHSCASWQRCWQAAGFQTTDEFTVTLWVRVFIVSKP
jgi:Methyltransferase domain